MKQTPSRRSFLKSGGIALGAGLATCCGLTTLAVQAPDIPLTEVQYGDAKMSSKILIAYATRCGSTIEVAERIAQIISQSGASVDVLPAKSHPETRSVRGTNTCRIAVAEPLGAGTVVVQSVIDNLVKGAAGQAIQNMNLMFGYAESAALDDLALLP